MLIPEKFFSHQYINLAMPTLESKVNFLFLSSAQFFSCSRYFDFSYLLSSAQVSLDCATLGHQINRWKDSSLFKVYQVYSLIYSVSCFRYAKPVAMPKKDSIAQPFHNVDFKRTCLKLFAKIAVRRRSRWSNILTKLQFQSSNLAKI